MVSHQGKSDMERLGVFKEMSYISYTSSPNRRWYLLTCLFVYLVTLEKLQVKNRNCNKK